MASGYHVGQHSFKEKNENENITNYLFSFLLSLPKLSSKQSLKFLFLKKFSIKYAPYHKSQTFLNKLLQGLKVSLLISQGITIFITFSKR